MPLKCNSPERLRQFIAEQYKITPTHPSGLASKHEFSDGLVVNIFNNGTVNFQGKSHENQTVQDIESFIEIINRS